jgi:TonB family protein
MSRTILLMSLLLLILALVSCKDGKQTGAENQSQVLPPSGAVKSEPPMDQQIVTDEPPKAVKRVTPTYPDSARRNGIEGIVYVSALIDEQGAVRKAVVQKRVDGVPEFEKASLDAAKQWTFTPVTKDKKPVEVWVTIPFRFKLAK